MSVLAYPKHDRAERIAQMEEHMRLDQLRRGESWNPSTHRGCAIGCLVHKYDHQAVVDELGLPHPLPRLIDFHFENLSDNLHMQYPLRILKAVKEGADLNGVFAEWAVRMLTRCIGYCGDGDETWRESCRAAIRDVIASLETGVGLAAARAAARAAGATAGATAGDAAWAAAWAARAVELRRQAEDLIELLVAAPLA